MSVIAGRHTANHPGPLVVFVIGIRINHFHKPHRWLPVVRSMRSMIAELAADPASGFLGAEFLLRDRRTLALLQYWAEFDRLEAYARAPDKRHRPAWTAFNKAVGNDGTVGIFHETYVVPAGGHETIYVNMPPFGLGKATRLVPAAGKRREARDRLHAVTADGE